MSRRGAKAAALGWLPVVAIVAALFAAPSSSGQVAAGSLTVTPGGGQYGGTNAKWVATGLPANARAHLQRRGTTTSAWADVENSFGIGTTSGSGRIEFNFPTPAMNSVYFRVVAGRGATEAHHFTSKHQDAELAIIEHNQAEKALPNGAVPSTGLAVNGEPFSFEVDTADQVPVLPGREVTLQRRVVTGGQVSWVKVDSGRVGDGGKVTFGAFGPQGMPQVAADYRVRLENWSGGGDQIGWFVSFPFDLRLVDRPRQVLRLSARAPSESKVQLTWALPADPERDKIIIARSTFGTPDLGDEIVRLPGTATSYDDLSVWPSTTFRYAVYTLSSRGIYSREAATVTVTTPDPPPPPPSPRGEG